MDCEDGRGTFIIPESLVPTDPAALDAEMLPLLGEAEAAIRPPRPGDPLPISAVGVGAGGGTEEPVEEPMSELVCISGFCWCGARCERVEHPDRSW